MDPPFLFFILIENAYTKNPISLDVCLIFLCAHNFLYYLIFENKEDSCEQLPSIHYSSTSTILPLFNHFIESEFNILIA